MNLLAWLVREAARRLGPGYDAEILELHHAKKRMRRAARRCGWPRRSPRDAGIALEGHLVLERAGETGARPPGAIGIQALRAGDSAGDHTVLFAGEGERLELAHRSQTRDHFARGAVRAAAWLAGRPAGLYRIEQVLGLDA